MQIAILSPLPPSKSGIADYSAALSDAMARKAPVDTFGSMEELPDLSAYDATIYQIGNNGDHGFVYEEAISNPGIVVLHEANLHHLIAEITIKRGDWDGYMRAVEYDGGRRALEFAQAVRRLEIGPDYDGVPMLRKLLRRARGLIVHSEYVATICRGQGYNGPLAIIPHGAWFPDVEGDPFRKQLGLRGDEFLFGIFGHLKPYKRITETLRAFRRLVKQVPHARLILVGEPHPDLPIKASIESLDLREYVRLIGFAPAESFVGYMAACDAVVNLRYPTVGESSGSMLRALGLGKPVLVSEVGAFSEFPGDICLKVPAGGLAEEDLILEYMRYLSLNPDAARQLGENARQWAINECSWDRVAEKYLAFAREVRDTEPGEPTPTVPEEPSKPAEEIAELFAAPVAKAEMIAENAIVADAAVAPVAVSREETDGGASEEPPAEPAGSAEEKVCFEREENRSVSPDASADAVDQPREEDVPDNFAHPLAEELLQWAPNDAARSYLIQHLSRLTATLDLLPDGTPEQSILEMGCYMQITPALREVKRYGEVRGCYYGELGETTERSATTSDGRKFSCVVDAFDAERDIFPYADGSFDAVLCTELFEHLGYDPFHCLAEVNRILKPGGLLLLTTPNACSLRAIAAILDQYHPGFFPAFMKPNAEGELDPRHHREYAPREIRMALEDTGFRVRDLLTAPYWRAPEPEFEWIRHLLERYDLDKSERGECIFALGEKVGEVRNRFPEWLYYG